MISKSKLLPLLIENGFIDNPNRVGFEAFGRKVFAYVPVKDMETRQRMERFLAKAGHAVNPRYCVGHPVSEVRVSYFKAHHWDE